ncbi:MAG: ATP-dependent Clp protease ATP-binding subunit [Oscillospiraceae bacterium]|nr:ATP-dependent Clp protease ATP-binding subunit [Oscillospiraceae bacterium]
MNNKFTQKAQEVLQLAHQAAADMGHGYVGSEHLLLGFLRENEGVAAHALTQAGVEEKTLEREIIQAVGTGETQEQPLQGLTPRTKRIIEIASHEASRMGHNYIGTEHLLMGILHEPDSIASRLLVTLGVDVRKLYNDIVRTVGGPETISAGGSAQHPFIKEKKKDTRILSQFSRDLTVAAADGRLDPVIGREDEITRIIQILSRRTKNNPCLIGEPGVGKTAVAEGLAQRIHQGDVPENLRDKRLVSLDLSGLVAGTKYRGEFEERLKSAMEEIKAAQNIIIFIDEIHTLVGAGAAEGAIDAANILKPALARGEMQVIGATTHEEYRKYIEKDKALERRFQPVTVGESSPEETVLIIKGLRDRYEAHHKVSISDNAIEAAVSLSRRYIADRFLPDKAIDLIDEAASRLRMNTLTAPPDLRSLEENLESIRAEKDAVVTAQKFEEAAKLRDREKELEKELEERQQEWKQTQGSHGGQVTEQEVASVVAGWTGIPATKLTEDESARLMEMENILHKRVVGQNEAVNAAARSIRRGRVGLKDPNRPAGSFIFLGPTGVGKTELCKALAQALFDDENNMIRLDMSEFMEKHTVSKLIGSPPGYVGYDEAGGLTEKIRRKPYSVVLFDEIEKAHPDVFNLLLQILEDGILTDSHGRKVSFKNTIIIMTSNLGARNITEPGKLMGFMEDSSSGSDEAIRNSVMQELKKTFRPEFLNRVDEVIVFHKLRKDQIRQIAEKMLEVLKERLAGLGVDMSITAEALDLVAELGFDPVLGARPLRRAIQTEIEDVLAEKMLRGEIKGNVKISTEAGKLVIQ